LLLSTGLRKECAFCAKNGESSKFLKSHNLRDSKTGVLECPILRSHHCEICGATGDFAHTRSHCPRFHMQQGGVQSTAHAIRGTRRKPKRMERKNWVKNWPLLYSCFQNSKTVVSSPV